LARLGTQSGRIKRVRAAAEGMNSFIVTSLPII
jgi:hypothetical protein